ncbi:ferredoxin--NADP reductase [Ulvibacter antarcticus]|uniref:ferredoxin--NADP reductase n=1 Tax=Ulvibacter antarcticus TaxID=442714 RepID=UPI000EF99819|nr:ferredoxin--NADP reductase [Ulvibacter antarcticus]
MNTFHTLTISEVKQETPNAVSITFSIPVSLSEAFSFKAGQYVTIKHIAEGTELRRAYSICSLPGSDSFTIGVKRVEGGKFSGYANDVLKAGDTLEVMPPGGKFVLSPVADVAKNYAAFAAGSGITPVLSIIKTALSKEPNSTFLLVYGNKTAEDSMYLTDLASLQEKYPNRLKIQMVYSRKEADNALFGRIDRSVVNFLLKNKYKDTTFNEFYLCGPEPMIDDVASTLKENHINTKQIHFELFTTSEGDLLVQAHDGTTTITVVLDDETETFSMPQSKSVLDAVLENDLDAPYSCQGGICSTCIARIKEGKAEMRKNQILTDSEIAEGLILTCQAHPTTATLIIDYDDV